MVRLTLPRNHNYLGESHEDNLETFSYSKDKKKYMHFPYFKKKKEYVIFHTLRKKEECVVFHTLAKSKA